MIEKKKKRNIKLTSRIVHVIPNIIHPGLARTRVLRRLDRTAIRRGRLRRRIRHEIAIPLARVALKRVKQAQPMPGLMNDRLPHIIPDDRPARHRIRLDIAPVQDEGRRVLDVARGPDRRRQRAPTEDVPDEIGLEVDVQRRVRAGAEGALHRLVVVRLADGPGVVDGPGRVDEVELDFVRGVGAVQGRDLRFRHRRRDRVLCRGRPHDVEVRRYAERLLAAGGEGGGGALARARRPGGCV